MIASTERQAEDTSCSTNAEDTLSSRPVLVAVDLLPASDRPVLWACRHAQKIGAPVCVVHAVHEPVSTPGFYNNSRGSISVPVPLRVAARRMLDTFLSRMRAANPDLSPLHYADNILVTGLPQIRIVEVAEKKEAQLLVIGHRSRHGLQKLLDGSTAWHVMQSVSTPVVVIT